MKSKTLDTNKKKNIIPNIYIQFVSITIVKKW